jgi:hypothetical protein
MPEITYRQLHEILRSLGFAIYEPQPGKTVYEHPASGALLVYSSLPEDKPVYPHHLLGFRATLDSFGIATEPEFASRLLKAC